MSINKDQISGRVKVVKGSVQQVTEKIVGGKKAARESRSRFRCENELQWNPRPTASTNILSIGRV